MGRTAVVDRFFNNVGHGLWFSRLDVRSARTEVGASVVAVEMHAGFSAKEWEQIFVERGTGKGRGVDDLSGSVWQERAAIVTEAEHEQTDGQMVDLFSAGLVTIGGARPAASAQAFQP